MSYADRAFARLNYHMCRYGRSRQLYRGPPKDLALPYVAVLGGSEVFGACVAHPFSDLLEAGLGVPTLNLGRLNAGVDGAGLDPETLGLCQRAEVTVLQVMGLANMSNSFYRVHPRRNDRLVTATEKLRRAAPQVDFTAIHFTGHLLATLADTAPEVASEIEAELRTLWPRQMRRVIAGIRGPTVLLWLRDMDGQTVAGPPRTLAASEAMVAEISDLVSSRIDVVVSRAGGDVDGMVLGMDEAGLAAQMLNVAAHRLIAAALLPALRAQLDKKKPSGR